MGVGIIYLKTVGPHISFQFVILNDRTGWGVGGGKGTLQNYFFDGTRNILVRRRILC